MKVVISEDEVGFERRAAAARDPFASLGIVGEYAIDHFLNRLVVDLALAPEVKEVAELDRLEAPSRRQVVPELEHPPADGVEQQRALDPARGFAPAKAVP